MPPRPKIKRVVPKKKVTSKRDPRKKKVISKKVTMKKTKLCVACKGTGKNSKGRDCIPCSRRNR